MFVLLTTHFLPFFLLLLHWAFIFSVALENFIAWINQVESIKICSRRHYNYNLGVNAISVPFHKCTVGHIMLLHNATAQKRGTQHLGWFSHCFYVCPPLHTKTAAEHLAIWKTRFLPSLAEEANWKTEFPLKAPDCFSMENMLIFAY